MDRLTTDNILDVAKHIEDRDGSAGKFLAEHGLELELGAMRLNPIEWTEEDEQKTDCTCIVCELRRALESDGND